MSPTKQSSELPWTAGSQCRSRRGPRPTPARAPSLSTDPPTTSTSPQPVAARNALADLGQLLGQLLQLAATLAVQRLDISRPRPTTPEQSPRSQAWIDTLRHAEGTWQSGGSRVRVPSPPPESCQKLNVSAGGWPYFVSVRSPTFRAWLEPVCGAGPVGRSWSPRQRSDAWGVSVSGARKWVQRPAPLLGHGLS